MAGPTTKTASAAKPKKAEAAHPTYKDMITDAITTLKERNGSSRQALKKYIQSNFKELKNFDTQFNAALRRGVDKGDFVQPKGPSGPVKLKKKEPVKKPAVKADAADKPKKAAAKKETKKVADKEAKPKKAAAKKETAEKKPKEKKEKTEKVAAKPKANAAKKVKKAAAAPAVADKPTVLTKTKSGRVSKGTAAPRVAKKAAIIKKKATPKKAAAAPAAEA